MDTISQALSNKNVILSGLFIFALGIGALFSLLIHFLTLFKNKKENGKLHLNLLQKMKLNFHIQ